MMDPASSSRNNNADKVSSGDIFLSHSGNQKNFVEHLYDALQRANQTAFLDKHSLPLASPFPDYIKRALYNCKLGVVVVVLSDDFFSSKWPMLELEWMILYEKRVFPLFYMLTPQDLTNCDRWQKKWIELVGEQQAERWGEAVRKLRSINGLIFKRTEISTNGIVVFRQEQSETAYINTVTAKICNLVPSVPLYDLSDIQGHHELGEEINRHFHELGDIARCKEARMVGLHGVSGLGKTTLCMSMANFYISLYLGRSCLIEFPTNGDEAKILQACKLAIRRLAVYDNNVLEGVDRFEQVIRLMKDRVREHDLFLAIDNVWPNSEKTAKALLGVGFSAASKILLTSQSQQVLQNLLAGYTKNSYIGPLPTPKHEDARRIFENSLNVRDLISSPVRNKIDKVLQRYRFDGSYHPLALTALGSYLTGLVGRRGQDLSVILEQINYSDLESLDEKIKLNYTGLEVHLKHMFLDIAVWVPHRVLLFHKRTHANVVRWLSFFYKTYTKLQIIGFIQKLAGAAVIQIKDDEDGKEMIVVHDLYLDLAQREVNGSPKFFKSTKQDVEETDWEKLERIVILEEGKGYQFSESKCYKELQLLSAAHIEIPSRIYLKSMPALRVLLLFGLRFGEARHATNPILATLKGLRASRKINLKGLVKLELLCLEDCNFIKSFEGLDVLWNLQMLFVAKCPCLESLAGVRCLTQLEVLDVRNCGALKEIPDLVGATSLERLMLDGNGSLGKVGWFNPSIKELSIENCGALKMMPNLAGVTALEKLTLSENGSLEEVGWLSPALKEVCIENCAALKGMLDLGHLTDLERLTLSGNGSMEEVVCLSPALKEVNVSKCGCLKKLPDFGGVTGLERLMLVSNGSLKEVGCLSLALKEVIVMCCYALKRMPDLGGLTSLERLELAGNSLLEEVGCLSPALKEINVRQCMALKKLPDFRVVTGLERLTLDGIMSLEELGYLSPCLRDLRVVRCAALKKMLDLGVLTGLEMLALDGNGALEDLGCLGPSLKEVFIVACGALKKIPDLGDVTSLERLALISNRSLEEVGCLSLALKKVIVVQCGALKKTPDLSGLLDLESLMLMGNGSLEEVGCLSPAVRELSIVQCGALRKIPDLGGLTGLERLMLSCNESLEEVGCVSSVLNMLLIENCRQLRSLNVLELRGGGWTEEDWTRRLVQFSVNTLKFSLSRYVILDCLHHLIIEECGTIQEMRVGGLSDLISLEVRKCEELKEVVGLNALQKLEKVTLHECGCLEDRSGDVSALGRRGLEVHIEECPLLHRRLG